MTMIKGSNDEISALVAEIRRRQGDYTHRDFVEERRKLIETCRGGGAAQADRNLAGGPSGRPAGRITRWIWSAPAWSMTGNIRSSGAMTSTG